MDKVYSSVMNPQLSIFLSIKGKTSSSKYLDVILSEIKNGSYDQIIQEIRDLTYQGKTEEAGKIKKTLPAFTGAGLFNGRRLKKNLSEFSRIVILDFDNISGHELVNQIFEKICSLKTTLACFLSPSRNGLKVLVPISSNSENYEKSYLQVAEYYKGEVGWNYDPSCKDITRLCFFSSDPNLYQNMECKVFQVNNSEEEVESKSTSQIHFDTEATAEEIIELFKKALSWTRKIRKYQEGNRNNFIYLLACNCARLGIPKENAENLILSRHRYNVEEIISTIASAYKNVLRSAENDSGNGHLFSINLLNLKNYKPDVDCDKRVFFEALIIKALSFNGTFYLSIIMIQNELGIKKARAGVLIQEFKALGLITTQVKKWNATGQPRQIKYFTVIPERIEAVSELLLEDNTEFIRRISQFLTGDIFFSNQE